MKYLYYIIILFISNVTNAQNVGINNTDPDRPLTIQGSGDGSEIMSLRDVNNSRRWHINLPDITGLSFNVTNQRDHVLHLAKDGRVGINTGIPDAALHVNAVNNDNLALFISALPEASVIVTNNSISTRLGYNAQGSFVSATGGNTLNLIAGNQRRVSILSNGNVGIGFPSPNFRLHVGGVAMFEEGIMLNNDDRPPHVFNYYENTAYNTDIVANNAAVANGYFIKVIRVGNQVTVTLPAERLTLNVVGTQELTFSTRIGEHLRPTGTEVRQPIQVLINGALATGLLIVKTDGTIALRPSVTNTLALWTGVANCGFYACGVSYIL
ncbi:MAG: hypothetical protein MUF24_08740 [Chitinophagaceae bacterium]|nr:hypothetical protein [Chitinophagaceae bacterium]